jgi:hypothetical protein
LCSFSLHPSITFQCHRLRSSLSDTPIPQVGGRTGDAVGPEQWFRSLPVITQYWFGSVVTLTLAGNFGVVNTYHLHWDWDGIALNLQVWRVITCFLYMGPFSPFTVITCYLLVSFSQRYESCGAPFNTGAGVEPPTKRSHCSSPCCGLVSYPVLGPDLGLYPSSTPIWSTTFCTCGPSVTPPPTPASGHPRPRQDAPFRLFGNNGDHRTRPHATDPWVPSRTLILLLGLRCAARS